MLHTSMNFSSRSIYLQQCGRRLRDQPPQGRFEADYFQRRESQELLRHYYRIGDTLIRKRLLGLVKAVAAAQPDPGNRDAQGADKEGG